MRLNQFIKKKISREIIMPNLAPRLLNKTQVLGSSVGLLNFFLSFTHGVPSIGYEILEPLVAKANKLSALHANGQLTTFVRGDFLDASSTAHLRQAKLVFLTSLCWDEGLLLALDKKLAATLADDCLVVDYTARLEAYSGTPGVKFELVGKVPVICSWSKMQLFIYKKKGNSSWEIVKPEAASSAKAGEPSAREPTASAAEKGASEPEAASGKSSSFLSKLMFWKKDKKN